MRVAIVSAHPRNEMLLKSFRKKFKKVVYIPVEEIKLSVGEDFQVLYGDEDLFSFDYVLTLPSYPKREFFYTLLRIIERDVEVPIPSKKFFMMWNKILLLRLLSQNGVKIRKTFAIAQNVATRMILNKIKLPVIITPPSGKRVLVKSKETLGDVLSLFRPGYMVIIEKPLKPRSVVNIFIAGDDVIAYQRVDGREEETFLDKEMKELSLKIKELLSADFCYLKLLKLEKKVLVSEVNLSPDFQKFYEITGKNIAEILASHIREKLEKKKRGWLDGFIDSLTSFVRWVENEIGNIRSS